MFGSQKNLTVAVLALFVATATPIFGQQPDENVNGNQPAAPQPKVTKELWQLLSDWADASTNIKKLHGKHVRRAYDHTFRIEKISQGEFWYEGPDKGRIDVQPVKITQKMLDARQQPDAKVERDPGGKPYELKSDLPERWICDGEKVYDIDDTQKEAHVVLLPPEIRGENIMNSPLPFLFGMPPEKAVQRFTMKILTDYRPNYNVVLLEAIPRLQKDAENWSSAKILLDTRTFLPQGVKLTNPAGTKDTRYTFQNMEVNANGIFDRFRKSPWDPDLDNSYKVNVIGKDQAAAAGGLVMPNVVGQAHDVATNMLLQAGVKRENIKKFSAGAAPQRNLVYKVREQKPEAGKQVSASDSIYLRIFDDPARAAKTTQRNENSGS